MRCRMWILHLDRRFIALISAVLMISITILSILFDLFDIQWTYILPASILLGLLTGFYINYWESKRISGRGDFIYGLRIYRSMPKRYLVEILILLLAAVVFSSIDPLISILFLVLLVLRILSTR